MAHVKDVIAGIAPHDSQERFEGLGVTVIREAARFVDGETVEAGGNRIKARRIVVATGSSPSAPPIPGLDSVDYFANETIFDNTTLPAHLIIIGGGPIGMEMDKADRRLGAKVTVLEGSICARLWMKCWITVPLKPVVTWSSTMKWQPIWMPMPTGNKCFAS